MVADIGVNYGASGGVVVFVEKQIDISFAMGAAVWEYNVAKINKY